MKIVEENKIGFVVATELEDIFNLIEMEIMYNFTSLSLSWQPRRDHHRSIG